MFLQVSTRRARRTPHQTVHITIRTAPEPVHTVDLTTAVAVIAHHVLQPAAVVARPRTYWMGPTTDHLHQLTTFVEPLDILGPANKPPVDEDTR